MQLQLAVGIIVEHSIQIAAMLPGGEYNCFRMYALHCKTLHCSAVQCMAWHGTTLNFLHCIAFMLTTVLHALFQVFCLPCVIAPKSSDACCIHMHDLQVFQFWACTYLPMMLPSQMQCTRCARYWMACHLEQPQLQTSCCSFPHNPGKSCVSSAQLAPPALQHFLCANSSLAQCYRASAP